MGWGFPGTEADENFLPNLGVLLYQKEGRFFYSNLLSKAAPGSPFSDEEGISATFATQDWSGRA
jgi:hypothetical protein